MSMGIEGDKEAFVSERNLSGFSPKSIEMLYQHRNDNPDFWRPRTDPKDDCFVKSIIERDEWGRITRRVGGSASLVEDTEGVASFFCLTYEEWKYDDQKGTAVMTRHKIFKDFKEEWQKRTYQDGVMVEQITATEFEENGERIIRLIKPLNQPDGTVIYASQKYQHEKLFRNIIQRGASLKPASQIELGSQGEEGEDRAVDYDDYDLDIFYHKNRRGILDLEKGFTRSKIPHSGEVWWVKKPVEAKVRRRDVNFVVKSPFGELIFPRELKYEDVVEAIKF